MINKARQRRSKFAATLLLIAIPLVGQMVRQSVGQSAFAESSSAKQEEPSENIILQTLPENPTLGSELFVEKQCYRCHSVLGHGGKRAPDLAKIKTGASFLSIATDMWNHAPRMKDEFAEFGIARTSVTAEEVSAIISFLYLLNFFDEPGDAKAGEALFRIKGCIQCHTIGSVGGSVGTKSVGPDLGHFAKYRSSVYLITALWNRLHDMKTTQTERHIEYPRFYGNELSHLVAYIRAEGGKTTPLEYWNYIGPGNPRRGRELFLKVKGCGECHKAAPGSSGRTIGPDLSTKQEWGSLTQIGSTLWNHGPAMWEQANHPLAKFEPTEMLDLLIYLYFIKYIDAPGNPSLGRELFGARGCSECHTVGSDEGAGPDLLEVWGNKTPAEIVSQMWNHSWKMTEAVRQENRAWPRLEKTDLAHLLAFVESERARLKTQ